MGQVYQTTVPLLMYKLSDIMKKNDYREGIPGSKKSDPETNQMNDSA
jgi:hypothetical protein